MRRFISADEPAYIGADGTFVGFNLFAYCANNPVNRFEVNGNWSLPNWAKIVVGVVTAAVAAVTVAVVAAAVAPAAVCSAAVGLMYYGVAQGAANAITTAAVAVVTVAATAYAADTGYKAATGESLLLNSIFGGNEIAYETGRFLTLWAVSGMVDFTMTYGAACFIAGTAILAAEGYVAIEEISIGDMVWAEDPETGEKGLKEVVQVFVNEATELVHVHVDGEEIICTTEHPFYSPVKGWTAAIDLRAGDILVTVNGEYVIVELIQHEILESPVKVYNFEVEGYHTYYVSEDGVLVHNECGKRNSADVDALIKLGKDAKRTGLSKSDADIMWEWVKELGMDTFRNYHAPMVDSYQGGLQLHMKVNGMHINVWE